VRIKKKQPRILIRGFKEKLLILCDRFF